MKTQEKPILLMLSFTVVLFSVLLSRSWWIQRAEQDKFKELRMEVEQVRKDNENNIFLEDQDEQEIEDIKRIPLPEYEALAQSNPDFVGWIRIDGTSIDYPVMQSLEEREYYLHRDFYGKESYAGTPFVGNGSLEDDDKAVFVYGHNMRSGTMFADLLKYRKKEYWNEHPIIELDTLYEHRKYEIIDVFNANAKAWSEPDEMLCQLANPGVYKTNKMIVPDGQLLLLVTCSYQEKDGRFVVAAVRTDQPA